MHGELTRDLISCIDKNGDLDRLRFLSLHPMGEALARDLDILEKRGYVTTDRDGSGNIVEFDITRKLLKLWESI